MLNELYPPDTLREILVPRKDWHPFPTTEERDAWQALPESLRKAHIARGEKVLGFEWPPLTAALFLDYVRTGNRRGYQGPRDDRRYALSDLVLAECVEGKGRFLVDIVNGIWGRPARRPIGASQLPWHGRKQGPGCRTS